MGDLNSYELSTVVNLLQQKLDPTIVIETDLNATPQVLKDILTYLPEHPPYYPKEMLTDKTERFFAAEIIREQILHHYSQEIPYAVEVVIEVFKDSEKIVHISATIYVEKKSQKGILIGKKGEALKQVGIAARRALEAFLGKQVFLEQHVKILPSWRSEPKMLERFGYGN